MKCIIFTIFLLIYPHGKVHGSCDTIVYEVMHFFASRQKSFSQYTLGVVAAIALLTVSVVFGSALHVYAQTPATPAAADQNTAATAPTPATEAATTADPNNGTCSGTAASLFCGFIAGFLGLVADFLGRMILLVISVLIAFAQYNGFATALPVETGWVLVRDTTNMFFILVLLLTAFATVIGNKDFYYETILPKLLLQAVLINFSRTLIQLLVDFSQVVMLTFVNAFSQAAAGNFVVALGLDKMMQIANSDIPGLGLSNLIVAYLLAWFFMGITLGVVIILTAYLVYRIVTIWVLMIVSPLAFFLTALPSKIASKVGAAGEEFWKKLSAALTGGPIIAFFLWLTLAITQQSISQANSAAESGGISTVLELTRPPSAGLGQGTGAVGSAENVVSSGADAITGATFGFLTSIADSNHVISFVIGIALLLTALDSAIASAALAMGVSAGFVKGAKNFGINAAKYPFKRIDQSLDVTGKMSRLGLNTLGRVPLLRDVVREPLQKGLIMRRKEASKIAGEQKSLIEDVSKYATDKETKEFGKTYGGFSQKGLKYISSMGTRATKGKISEFLADNKFRDNLAKREKKSRIEDLKKEAAHLNIPMTEQEAKAGSELLAKKDAYEDQGNFFREQMKFAQANGDTDTVEKLEKQLKSNPLLAAAGEGRAKAIKDFAESPDNYKDLDAFNANNGEVLTGIMLASGGWKREADGTLKLVDNAAWDRKKIEIEKSKNSTLQAAMEQHEAFVLNSPGVTVDQLNTYQHRLNPADGLYQTFALDESLKDDSSNHTGFRVRNSVQQNALETISTANAEGRPQNNTAISTAIGAGASLPEALAAAGYKADISEAAMESFAKHLADQMKPALDALEAVQLKVQTEIKTQTADIDAKLEPLKKIKPKDRTDEQKAEIKKLMDERAEKVKAVKDNNNIELSGARANAQMASKDMFKALAQIDASGMNDRAQSTLLAEFYRAGGRKLVTDNSMQTSQQQKAVLRGLEVTVRRYDDAVTQLKPGASLSPEMQVIGQELGELRREVQKDKREKISQAARKILTSAGTDHGIA